MANIRQATLDDIPMLMEMGKRMHQESPRFRMMDFSEDKCRQLGEALIPSGSIFIAEKEGEAVGMMIGFITEHYFGYDLMASDLAVYVVPEHRGGSLGVRLIKVFEQWAEDNGARVITLGISTEVEAKRTLGIYEKLGYATKGYITTKEIPASGAEHLFLEKSA